MSLCEVWVSGLPARTRNQTEGGDRAGVGGRNLAALVRGLAGASRTSWQGVCQCFPVGKANSGMSFRAQWGGSL